MLPLREAQAQTVWTGSNSTDWFTSANWSAGIPAAGVEATVNTANARDPLVAGGVTGRAGRVVIGNNFGQSGALAVTGTLTVDENVSAGSFIVGNLGTGAVTVSGGGRLTTGLTGIGNFGTGIGTVDVTGVGSTWTVTSTVDIGSSGSGTLNVSAGGVVNSGLTNVGNDVGAVGTLNVTGTGSNFAFSSMNIGAATGGTGTATISDTAQLSGGGLTVGSLGKGTLLVQSGADASGSVVTIGSSAIGQATITGAGSTLTSSGTTAIGTSSAGTLGVTAGGTVSSKRARLGTTAAGSGTATINGAGSGWSITEDLRVGEAGTGTLNVEAGAVLTANQVVMASNPGSAGTITVTGAGSQLNVTTSLQTGLATNVVGTSGKLNVTNGGVVNVGTGLLTDNLFANNTTAIVVDGAGSKLTIVPGGPGISTVMRLGVAGVNSLAVSNGGAVSVDSANFQTVAGSSVAVTVAGSGTSFTSNGLALGGGGTASLAVSGGASANTGSGNVTIEATGGGTVSISVSSGGTLTSTGFFQLRTGPLTIDSGGGFSGNILNIGISGGPGASATVSGAGSTLTTTGSLSVGSGGSGTLLVDNGASLITSAGNIGPGSVTLRGAGTTWTASNPMTAFINISATGSLTIEQAATMSIAGGTLVTGAIVVRDTGSSLQSRLSLIGGATGQILNGAVVQGSGGAVGSSGSGAALMTVDGVNSRWTMTGDLDVGRQTTGTLTIQASGRVSAQDIYIGCCATGVGTVNVTGSGALFEAAGTLRVGDLGNGTLDVTAGGDMTSAAALIAAQTGSVGKATVTGAGSTWTNAGTLAVGGAGTGTLTVTDSGAVTSTGAVSVGALGTLNVGTGGVAGTLTVPSIANDGTVRLDHSGTVTFGVSISGAGTFVKDAAGTTILTADNTYTGITTINAGTLQLGNGGATGAIVGNVANNGTLVISRSSTFTYGGVISGGGVLNQSGAGTTVLTGNSTYTGQTTISAGVLQLGNGGTSGAIIGNVINNATLNFNRSNDFSFAGIISGAGNVRQIGAGKTELTGDSSSFIGATSVESGILSVNGKLGGTLSISMTGRLQGTGTVGDTIVNGTIAPGNSIGTLNVAGNVSFNSGSIYEVEVNAGGQSDRLVATGTATITGGSVRVLAASGSYAPATTYTILTALGGRTGTFTGGVTSNLAFLDPSLSYDANNIYLTMTRNALAFTNVGLTPNQVATGGGVESLGPGNGVYDAVLSLSAAQAQFAFDQLSGEIHASLRTTLMTGSRFVRKAVIDRLRAAFDGAGASKGSALGYVAGNPVAVPATTDGPAFWSQAFGSWGHTGSDGNAARFSHSTGGFLIGGDVPVFDIWRVGVVAGYSNTSFDVTDRRSSGSSSTYHVGVYGGTSWGDLSFRSGAAYAWHDIRTNRSVVFPGFSDSLAGNYSGGTAQVFGELGYSLTMGSARLEPFANLAYVRTRTGGFTERGGAAALTGQGTTTDTTFTTVGLRAATGFKLGGAAVTANGTLGWRHAFGNVTPHSTMRLAGGGGAFSIGGVPVAADAAVVEAGLSVVLAPGAMLGLSYGGQFGSAMSDHSVKANLNVRF